MALNQDIISKASAFVFNLYKEEGAPRLVFHNYNHARNTAKAAEKLGKEAGLDEEGLTKLILAAWFHNTGYLRDYHSHESAAAGIAEGFLDEAGYPREKMDEVINLIHSTRRGHQPEGLMEEILHDAGIVHIGEKGFGLKSALLRTEWEAFLEESYSDAEWEQMQLDFLLSHQFLTRFALKNYGPRREKNIRKQRDRIADAEEDTLKRQAKREKLEKPQRGVETMYRTAFRNHINLSSIADSKANMMISINTIIMSVIITVGGSSFAFSENTFVEHLRFTLPIIMLLLSCLVSVIFAILSANPNITSKKVNMDKIRDKKSSLLFFGNFVRIHLDKFIQSMQSLMEDKDLLYDNMSIDLYQLGLVLERKYALLRWSYGIFMGGLILAVLAFIIIFLVSA